MTKNMTEKDLLYSAFQTIGKEFYSEMQTSAILYAEIERYFENHEMYIVLHNGLWVASIFGIQESFTNYYDAFAWLIGEHAKRIVKTDDTN